MQGGQGWNRDVLAMPGCEAQMSDAGLLIWCGFARPWSPCSAHVRDMVAADCGVARSEAR